MIEQLQWRVTKVILNNYDHDYYSRLLRLNHLPIMYTFELADIMFAVKSLKLQIAILTLQSTYHLMLDLPDLQHKESLSM